MCGRGAEIHPGTRLQSAGCKRVADVRGSERAGHCAEQNQLRAQLEDGSSDPLQIIQRGAANWRSAVGHATQLSGCCARRCAALRTSTNG